MRYSLRSLVADLSEPSSHLLLVQNRAKLVRSFLAKLIEMREHLNQCPCFQAHEVHRPAPPRP